MMNSMREKTGPECSTLLKRVGPNTSIAAKGATDQRVNMQVRSFEVRKLLLAILEVLTVGQGLLFADTGGAVKHVKTWALGGANSG